MVIKRGGGVRLLNKKTCGGKKRPKWKSLVSVNRFLWNKTEWRKENKKSSESWKKKKEEKKNKKSERRKKKELVWKKKGERTRLKEVWKKKSSEFLFFFPSPATFVGTISLYLRNTQKTNYNNNYFLGERKKERKRKKKERKRKKKEN